MKNISKLIAAFSFALALTSCTKDYVYEHYTFYRPAYSTKNEVKANIKSNPATAIENAGKIFVKDNYVFLNDVNKGVHIIDYSNPAAPVNKAFINIPGCKDIAVKGNYMYADCYTDLVTVDISNVNNVVLKNYINGVFPNRYYDANIGTDTGLVITQWVKVDTMIKRSDRNWREDSAAFSGVWLNNPSAMSNAGGAQSNGTGGSMASFALVGNRLYTVDNTSLKVFNTGNAAAPAYVTNVGLGNWNIETIYPFRDKLFIGSQSGMLIYSVSNPDAPAPLGSFSHAQMCDPVIADGNTAYVTLRSGTFCVGTSNQMDVLDIQDIMHPQLIKTYPMTNPAGLSKDGNALLVCDGIGGLKLFNAADNNNILQRAALSNIRAYDVIAINGTAIVSATDGIYFVNYLSGQLTVKGKINVN
ncbi:MAG: hypothetical protein QM687_03025 [Ferruginibacter sp.]